MHAPTVHDFVLLWAHESCTSLIQARARASMVSSCLCCECAATILDATPLRRCFNLAENFRFHRGIFFDGLNDGEASCRRSQIASGVKPGPGSLCLLASEEIAGDGFFQG